MQSNDGVKMGIAVGGMKDESKLGGGGKGGLEVSKQDGGVRLSWHTESYEANGQTEGVKRPKTHVEHMYIWGEAKIRGLDKIRRLVSVQRMLVAVTMLLARPSPSLLAGLVRSGWNWFVRLLRHAVSFCA